MVYGWEETQDFYVKVVRPRELFDLSTLQFPEPGYREGQATAIHRLSGERETYALVYGKGYRLEWLKRIRTDSDPWLERDRADLLVWQQAQTVA